MTTRQRYRGVLDSITSAVIQHIDFVEELQNDDFRKELGIDGEKPTSIRFTISAETVNGVDEVCSIHCDLD